MFSNAKKSDIFMMHKIKTRHQQPQLRFAPKPTFATKQSLGLKKKNRAVCESCYWREKDVVFRLLFRKANSIISLACIFHRLNKIIAQPRKQQDQSRDQNIMTKISLWNLIKSRSEARMKRGTLLFLSTGRFRTNIFPPHRRFDSHR